MIVLGVYTLYVYTICNTTTVYTKRGTSFTRLNGFAFQRAQRKLYSCSSRKKARERQNESYRDIDENGGLKKKKGSAGKRAFE